MHHVCESGLEHKFHMIAEYVGMQMKSCWLMQKMKVRLDVCMFSNMYAYSFVHSYGVDSFKTRCQFGSELAWVCYLSELFKGVIEAHPPRFVSLSWRRLTIACNLVVTLTTAGQRGSG